MKPFIFGLDVWEDQPGGTVIKRFKQNNESYVYIEFDKSPGKLYLYLDSE